MSDNTIEVSNKSPVESNKTIKAPHFLVVFEIGYS